MTGMARWRGGVGGVKLGGVGGVKLGGVGGVKLGAILAVSLGTAIGVLVGGPTFASGATAGSPAETGPSPTGTAQCPSSNQPNQMTLVAGTPQTASLGTAFATGLQVSLGNSDGCPVTSAAAGTPVTFSAPASGASGLFSTSASGTVTSGSAPTPRVRSSRRRSPPTPSRAVTRSSPARSTARSPSR